ncbi:MAG TPA: TIGR03118 family protein [Stellaceae bacterium]
MRPSTTTKTTLIAAAIAAGALCGAASRAFAGYVQTDLVSDIAGLAQLTEPELHNPWGMSHSPTSPTWTSNQGTGTANLFSITPTLTVTKVQPTGTDGNIAVPPGAGVGIGPTGQVNNTSTSTFLVGNGGDNKSAHFMFANLNGTISAWDTGQTAFVQATTPGAVYTGLAINGAQDRLYAANGAGAGGIDVFGSDFKPVSLSAGAFTDPNLPKGFVPFNVQEIGGKVYVTYAPQGRAAQTSATPGMGFIDVYDEDGGNLQRLVSNSQLAAPWGMTLAPQGFGEFGGDLLVGNFSFKASEINAFDPTSGIFEGTIPIDPGSGNDPGGLWALIFGNGAAGGDPNTLFFTDGINGETDGLFAALRPVPEPASLILLGAALAFGAVARRRRPLATA